RCYREEGRYYREEGRCYRDNTVACYFRLITIVRAREEAPAMPYHMWYLATSEERVPFHEYAELVEGVGDGYSLSLTEGTDAEWIEFALAHKKEDWPIGDLKWVPVRRGVTDDRGTQEIEWFLEEIEGCQPACNVPWLRQFLPRVKTVYV